MQLTTRQMNEQAWWDLLSPDTQQKAHEIYTRVHNLRQNKTIYPPENEMYTALGLTNPQDVKVVIIGQDPYHEQGEAMGLAFSVKKGIKIPPSLKNIYTELKNDLQIPQPDNGDLTKWAKQGVLLLNSVLTVEAHKANSHKDFEWQRLTSAILSICSKSNKPIVYLCWGQQAYTTLCAATNNNIPPNQLVLRSSHPSPFSAYTNTKYVPSFMGSKPFSKANAHLKQHGETPIDWNLKEN